MRALLEGLRDGPRRRLLIGVVHLPPTPGAPAGEAGIDGDSVMERLVASAVGDARALVEGGVDALIVENFGDHPFEAETVRPETVAAMAVAVRAVCDAVAKASIGDAPPVGVNVLRNDSLAALGLCAATGASFLRVNVHTGAAVTDQGLIQGRAAATLRERARLAPAAALLADVHVKHATPLGRESIADAAEETFHRGRADALIVSGTGTGQPVAGADLLAVRERVADAPLLVGSGLDSSNAAELLAVADGAIVGTALKEEGRLAAPVDAERVRALRAIF